MENGPVIVDLPINIACGWQKPQRSWMASDWYAPAQRCVLSGAKTCIPYMDNMGRWPPDTALQPLQVGSSFFSTNVPHAGYTEILQGNFGQKEKYPLVI